MAGINKRITYYRKQAGYTKRQMAEKMGLKYTTYCRIEDNSKINSEQLKKLSETLCIDVRQILYDDYTQDSLKYVKNLEEVYEKFSIPNKVVILTDENEKRLINLFRKCDSNKKYAVMEFMYYMYLSKLTFTEK